jgi:Mrp family chromosome partitioning ATPase
MSRLADALRRAASHDPAADLFRQTDQARDEALWGMDRLDAAALDGFPAFQSVDDVTAVNAVTAPPALPTRAPVPETGRSDDTAAVAPADFAAGRRNDTRDDVAERHLAALVDRVFLSTSGVPIHTVVFASTGEEVDSALLTATAAQLLAEQTARTVCVVDANFRTPSLHQRFGVPNVAGLAEALASDTPLAESARRLQRNLWIVPAGVATDRPSFAGGVARRRIAELMAQFDYVLVDIEPVTTGSVAGLLPPVDGVIVVLAADSTRREAARRATQAVGESGVPIIGAVLTNRRYPIPDALYRLL